MASLRTSTPKSNWGKLVNNGMGGFLEPPTHPAHHYSIGSIYGDTFSMCLESATACEWLDPVARAKASGLLKRWSPPPIESPEVQDWIRQVMGYFRGCYQSSSGSWQADCLRITSKWNPLKHQPQHAGVNLIRKYYPSFKLTQEILHQVYWGTKPSS